MNVLLEKEPERVCNLTRRAKILEDLSYAKKLPHSNPTRMFNVLQDTKLTRLLENALVIIKFSYDIIICTYCTLNMLLHIHMSCLKDIDECKLGYDICARDVQYCINTPGGFDCQNKKEFNRYNCPAGYKFNNYTLSCEGIQPIFTINLYSFVTKVNLTS